MEQLLAQILTVGGPPVQLAALVWLLVRVEQLKKETHRLEVRVEHLEAMGAGAS